MMTIQKRFTHKKQLLLHLALAIGSTAGLHAAAVIYEPFDQPAGGLNGASGGTGLGSWTSTAPNLIASPSLDYGILANAGNQVDIPAGQGSGSANATTAALVGAGLLDDGASLWFSVVTTGASGSNQHSGFALGTQPLLPSFDGARLNGDAVGFYTRQNNVQAATWSPGGNLLPDSLSGPLSAPKTSTNLIVGRIDWGATAGDDETVTLFTPSLGDLTLPGSSVATSITGFDQSNVNTVSFASRQGTQSFDEIRFGASYADVAPLVPEPSSTALLGLGGLAFMLRRRRG